MKRAAQIGVIAVLVAGVGGFAIVRESGRVGTRGDGDPSSRDGRGSAGGIPRLVDLGSTTCVPCKMMAPILEELRTEYEGRLGVEVIDIRADREAASKFGIRVIPTQIFFDASGRELFRHEGFYAKEDILAKWGELGIDISAGAGEEL